MTASASAPRPILRRVAFSELAGWRNQDHALALEAFQRSAREIVENGSGFRREAMLGGRREAWLPVCEAAKTAMDARQFFESHFAPCRVEDLQRPEGLFTGYFEPELSGSRQEAPGFNVPVYRKPDDLVAFSTAEESQLGLRYGRRINGVAAPYALRQDIEGGALAGRGLEICLVDSWVDAFFMHIQGNGRIRLTDGSTIRLSYAAKTGHPYTGIGGVLAERGILSRETMSMQTVKAWMADHPAEARQLMWLNKSYVFFQETAIEDQLLGAVGAAKVNLTPLHSMAIDRSIWMFGTPFWIETTYPKEARPQGEAIARLMIGQDTGSAIRGAVRGDFYWGWGEDAALVAGHMKSPGSMTVLLPHAVARNLELGAA
ncbi:MAG: MltA domain-containing protein [Proteobacteria bacterium]|nr:MltA domain-containing protein [Pseudomonadota bacterium]